AKPPILFNSVPISSSRRFPRTSPTDAACGCRFIHRSREKRQHPVIIRVRGFQRSSTNATSESGDRPRLMHAVTCVPPIATPLERDIVALPGLERFLVRAVDLRTKNLDQPFTLREELVVGHDCDPAQAAVETVKRAEPFLLPSLRSADDDRSAGMIRDDLRVVAQTFAGLLVQNVKVAVRLADRSRCLEAPVPVPVHLLPHNHLHVATTHLYP